MLVGRPDFTQGCLRGDRSWQATQKVAVQCATVASCQEGRAEALPAAAWAPPPAAAHKAQHGVVTSPSPAPYGRCAAL